MNFQPIYRKGELSKPQMQGTIFFFLDVVEILYYKILNSAMMKNRIRIMHNFTQSFFSNLNQPKCLKKFFS